MWFLKFVSDSAQLTDADFYNLGVSGYNLGLLFTLLFLVYLILFIIGGGNRGR